MPNFQTSFVMDLPVPEIQQLALSRDGTMIACAVESEMGDNSTLLYFAPVARLLHGAATHNTSQSRPVGVHATGWTNTTDPAPSIRTSLSSMSQTIWPWERVRFPRSVGEVKSLSVPSNDRIAFAVRKERTAASTDNSIEFFSFAMQQGARDFRSINIRGPGSSVYEVSDLVVFMSHDFNML